MHLEKTHTQRKKILLYRLEKLIRELYPHLTTINPYREQVQDYLQKLSLDEQLLYDGLLHALTVLNQNGRLKQGKRLVSSRGDVVGALRLLHSTDLEINPKAIAAYHKLCARYKESPFTLLEAQILLGSSRTTLRRYFKVLQGLELIKKCDQKCGFQHTWRLIKRRSSYTNKQSIFDQVFEEWKDFKGWVEL